MAAVGMRWCDGRGGIGPAYLERIIVGTLYRMYGACCTRATRRAWTIACGHRQAAAEFKATATYTELEGVQPQMDGEEESDSPFFLRQESHALYRFCTVDMVVTIEGTLRVRAPYASAHRMCPVQRTARLLLHWLFHSRYLVFRHRLQRSFGVVSR